LAPSYFNLSVTIGPLGHPIPEAWIEVGFHLQVPINPSISRYSVTSFASSKKVSAM
jgi:hypothetical protein